MVTPLKVHGADASHHQAGLNLKKAAENGLEFLYHKATEGTSYFDLNYSTRRKDAKEAGLAFGAYHYAHPRPGNAANEANYFLAHAQPEDGDLIPALDLEINEHNMSRAELTSWVGVFCRTVFKKIGWYPVIYTGFDLDHNFGSMLWRPRYSNSNEQPVIPHPWKRYDIWQFSDGQYGVPRQFAGLGNVDLNHLNDHVHVRNLIMKPQPAAKDSRAKTGQFRIMTQNIKALPLMAQDEVVHDVNLTARQCGIIGFQEIDVDRYMRAVESLEKSGKWETYWGRGGVGQTPDKADAHGPAGYDSPIAWRKKYWEFVRGGRFKVHEGLAKVMTDRYATWVLLKHKKTGALLYVVNFHLVAGAWNKEDKAHKAERPGMWRHGWNLVQDEVGKLIDAEPDAAVAMTGDYNASFTNDKVTWGDMRLGQRKIKSTFDAAIDHVLLINGARFKWAVDGEHTCRGRNSDHQGRQLEAHLTW